ncbi:MAG: lineage-specific thermal regulator protein [Candidatus Bathyarchaeota archaeon BA1]|nr:MAG: lineage-specific thermal regulator protein [Candidatus Bathyarchaeota archaeon BA1]
MDISIFGLPDSLRNEIKKMVDASARESSIAFTEIIVTLIYITLLSTCSRQSNHQGEHVRLCGGCHGGCWHSYPERGWIQFLILRVLYEKPMHGYQLLEEIDERSCGCHRLETGSIYTLLRRMEERSLLESRWEKVETGPDRRVYKVTARGAEVLRNGLKTIVKRRALFDDLAAFYKEHFEGGGK